ncbi:MAG: dephospho-CoA kinase [Bacteroidota bacterium]
MKWQIGITGGIGSGKSTVASIFKTLGIPIYSADDRAKALMMEDPILINQIRSTFGDAAYRTDGTLDRAYLAKIVFKDPDQLRKLESFVHPAVARDTHAWQQRQVDVPYTLREAALLFEAGGYKHLDQIITVYTPQEERVQRVMERDQTTREAVLARMAQQWSDEEKMARSDYIIHNYANRSLIQQVLAIHRQILQLKPA